MTKCFNCDDCNPGYLFLKNETVGIITIHGLFLEHENVGVINSQVYFGSWFY